MGGGLNQLVQSLFTDEQGDPEQNGSRSFDRMLSGQPLPSLAEVYSRKSYPGNYLNVIPLSEKHRRGESEWLFVNGRVVEKLVEVNM